MDEVEPDPDEGSPADAGPDTLEEWTTSAPAAFSNAVVRYYVTDHLGSPRVVLDAQRQVLDRHDYEPFGVELTPFTDQADLTHRFTGHERDLATGYDYMHFRFYGSNMGRFLKPDNIPGALTDPQSWNLYAYVRNNPANLNDPTGHIWNTGFIGTDESQHPGAYPDNGEMPLSSAGLLPEGMGTIGSSEPLSFIISRLSAAGFSMAAIRYAISNQPDLSPSIALYTVHSNGSDLPHSALGATLGGETIFLSHGGSFSDFRSTEKAFIEYYNSFGDSVTISRLKGTPEQNMQAAMAIGKIARDPNLTYSFLAMNCLQVASAVIQQAYGTPAVISGASPESLRLYVKILLGSQVATKLTGQRNIHFI